ncbi:N-acetyltransferase GCN5 [Roseibium aquae]|uniref:N-acetyltransferase GCN5 n=1 Tax=Roseibium aquae TaxID=1323746 RepID=A0A916TC10_9HYPH|nr:GNAT family N-acetyltransferase [Roseibium aquae]GGB38223.1 N-acetyltransferase GCN5 [Roseibium aquae]
MTANLIDLRVAQRTDCEALASIHSEAWLGAYRGLLDGVELQRMVTRRNAGWWRGALARGVDIRLLNVADEPVGYATFGSCRLKSVRAQGEIYELYLRPEYQGLGFGRRLFEDVRAELDGRGLEGLAVQVLSDNAPARAFYRALGGQLAAKTFYQSAEKRLELVIYVWSVLESNGHRSQPG